MPSTEGETKAKKSEGVIQGGTARTATIVHSGMSVTTRTEEGPAALLEDDEGWPGRTSPVGCSRNMRTIPSGKLADP